ncbi:MAG TPA: tetratricopeptide repeat protein [Pyrinomonadaceae bacterium]|jgi:tetratricopeptide (TPR) repeat protein
MEVGLRTLLPALLWLVVSVMPAAGQTNRTAGQRAIDDGNALVAQGHYERALKVYETVSSSSGELYGRALYNIGVCHYELWHTAEAIEFYRRAIQQREGRYPHASYALGVALEDAGRTSEAVKAYKQVLATTNDASGAANYRLGVIAAAAGDTVEAARLFRKALDHRGEHVPASHNNLGVMLARLHRLSEAEKEFTLALRSSNGSYSDAAYNLELCRQLMSAGTEAKAIVMRVTDGIN